MRRRDHGLGFGAGLLGDVVKIQLDMQFLGACREVNAPSVVRERAVPSRPCGETGGAVEAPR